MGKIKNNVVTKGFSGKFGDDLVFRQIDNKTVFTRRTLSTAAPSERQTQVRNKFLEASNYASMAIDNPQTSVAYAEMADLQKMKSAYVAAMTDFLTLPEIAGVFTASYQGKVNDVINIMPKVAYKVVTIDVTILRADGSVVESGKAAPANQGRWKYVASVANPAVAGSKLVLVAHDRQGKQAAFEKVM